MLEERVSLLVDRLARGLTPEEAAVELSLDIEEVRRFAEGTERLRREVDRARRSPEELSSLKAHWRSTRFLECTLTTHEAAQLLLGPSEQRNVRESRRKRIERKCREGILPTDKFGGVHAIKIPDTSTQDARTETLVIESSQRASYRIGRLYIHDVQPIVFCSAKGQPHIPTVRFEFEDADAGERRRDPPEWETLQQTLVPKLHEDAAAKGKTFENQPIADVLRVRIGRDEDRTSLTYRLIVGESDYEHFAALSNSLDLPIEEFLPNASAPTLRALWDGRDPLLQHPRLEIAHRFPGPVRIGTVTVLVSIPEQVIVCVERSRSVYEATAEDTDPQRAVHFVGEGCIPKDRSDDGRVSPAKTALRAIDNELMGWSDAGDAISVQELIPTGVFFDTLRWQPVFCYLVFTNLSLASISSRQSRDRRFEADSVFSRPWDVYDKATRRLLLGEDPAYRLITNHAQIGLLLALFYHHGPDEVEQALR